jgi:lysophospholipase L1-like esterase
MKLKVKIPAIEVEIEVVDEAPPPPPPPPSIAGLPVEVLLYWSGGEIEHLASAPDGTGAVDGLSDASTVGCLADLSSHGRPLVQADPSKRPIAGRHPKGLGVALWGAGTRSLAATAALAGAQHVYAVITPVGPDLSSQEPLPVPFKAGRQSIVSLGGTPDEAHSAVVGLEESSQLWLPDGACFVDGIEGVDVGAQYRRRIVRVSRTSLAAGPLTLLDPIWPAQSYVHEVVVLSGSATAEHHALVQAHLARHKAAPVVALAVDSLSTGYGLTYHRSLAHLLSQYWRGGVSTPSIAAPGQRVETALTVDAAKLALVRGEGSNILVFEGGANDIFQGATWQTALERLLAYGAMASAAGWQVALCSVPEGPLWSGIGRLADVQALNAYLAMNWQAHGFAAYIPLGAPEAQGDGLHYDAAGAAAVAAQIAAVLDTML